MPYRSYPPSALLLFGYDPERDLPADHLARLVEQVVEEAVRPALRPVAAGQPPFDPRLCVKVLVYGYATGTRSSRRLEQLCQESLPYLYLTRGDAPSYRTICSTRVKQKALVQQVWVSLFVVADRLGMKRLGQLVVDSTKLRADASPEAVLKAEEYGAVLEELERILEEAAQVDEREEKEGRPEHTRLGEMPSWNQMRDMVRHVRKQLTRKKRAANQPPGQEGSGSGSVPAGVAAGEPRGRAGEAGGTPGAADPPGGCATEEKAEAAVGATEPENKQWHISKQMRDRIEAAVDAIRAATTEGREHHCLTDAEARMMGGGRDHKVHECHSWEVGVDRAAGLLVHGDTNQESSDNARLEAVVEGAAKFEPGGVLAVDADSGYYGGDALGRLIEAGVDTCVPDSNTAGDLHRGQPVGTIRDRGRGKVPLEYDRDRDQFVCPEGNELRVRQRQHQSYGQKVTEYRAVRSCEGCHLAGDCLTKANARYRSLKVGEHSEALEAARQRFNDPAHQERYHHRGEVVETVFGFLRGVLGYTRWFLRGSEKVACEGVLFKTAYQIRKVHGRWAAVRGG